MKTFHVILLLLASVICLSSCTDVYAEEENIQSPSKSAPSSHNIEEDGGEVSASASVVFPQLYIAITSDTEEWDGSTIVTIKAVELSIEGTSFMWSKEELNKDIAEPLSFTSFNSLPCGLSPQNQKIELLSSENDKFSIGMGDTPFITYYISYIVRTKDSNLALGWSETYNRDSGHIIISYSENQEDIQHELLLQIDMNSVQFNAVVDSIK